MGGWGGGRTAPALITVEEIAAAGAPSPCELPGNSPPPAPPPAPAHPLPIPLPFIRHQLLPDKVE